jgi:hypothetical protein
VSSRPLSGVRYALERTATTPEQVVYEGLVCLPDAELAVTVRVELPGGAVRATVAAEGSAFAARAPDFTRTVTALVRAATKVEVATGLALPRKIVRWRG